MLFLFVLYFHVRIKCFLRGAEMFNGTKQIFSFREVVAQARSVKKVFLEISQNSQESTCARASFLVNLQASGLQLF